MAGVQGQKPAVIFKDVDIDLRGQARRLRYFDRPGSEGTMLYVHGLGCSKADFLGMTREACLKPYRLVSYDQPGCGESRYDPAHPLNIDGLVELLDGFVTAMGLSDFLLVAGSMGGLVALLYAERHFSKLAGFVNVEGNLAPEDCMFSARVAPHDYAHFERAIFPQIKAELAAPRKVPGAVQHLEVLRQADPRAFYDYSPQTVSYSHDGNLLERFLSLPVPRYFLYGSENRHLSYLPRLRRSDCKVIEIPNADHFLFYSNPGSYAAALAQAAETAAPRRGEQ